MIACSSRKGLYLYSGIGSCLPKHFPRVFLTVTAPSPSLQIWLTALDFFLSGLPLMSFVLLGRAGLLLAQCPDEARKLPCYADDDCSLRFPFLQQPLIAST